VTLSEPAANEILVTVVLPCLDEEGSVGQCVEEALHALRRAGLDGEVIVVDNGSTDRSAAEATRAGARVVPEAQPGYGSALRAGFRAARGRVVVMADADFTYPLDKIPELVAPVLADEADLVLGTRLEGASRDVMPLLHRHLGTPALNRLVARAADSDPVSDSQTGFRAMRRSTLEALELRSTGMELASEMLVRAGQTGSRIVELPTGYRARIGQSKLNPLADGWRHLSLIVLLAPHLTLVMPGAVLLTIGVALTVLTLIDPGGFALGSLRWQPVFFSSIAVVLGAQMSMAGVVLARRSTAVGKRVSRRYRFVHSRNFWRRFAAGGAAALGAGLAIDLMLFIIFVTRDSPPARGLALASLAQTLILCGSSIAIFAFVFSLVSRAGQPDQPSDAHDPRDDVRRSVGP
jgi:hypothetical protein